MRNTKNILKNIVYCKTEISLVEQISKLAHKSKYLLFLDRLYKNFMLNFYFVPVKDLTFLVSGLSPTILTTSTVSDTHYPHFPSSLSSDPLSWPVELFTDCVPLRLNSDDHKSMYITVIPRQVVKVRLSTYIWRRRSRKIPLLLRSDVRNPPSDWWRKVSAWILLSSFDVSCTKQESTNYKTLIWCTPKKKLFIPK